MTLMYATFAARRVFGVACVLIGAVCAEDCFYALLLKVREAFFNFLFHVVNDCPKRTGGRAANSKVKTQKSFFQQSQKKKRKRKKRAFDEI